MATKKKNQPDRELRNDQTVEDLVKIAFGNILDFARFEADGRVHIFDWDKAREVGVRITVKIRKVGRGKNASEVRTTQIKMPDKVSALCKLIKLLSPPRRIGGTTF